jgi:hypothetical protein
MFSLSAMYSQRRELEIPNTPDASGASRWMVTAVKTRPKQFSNGIGGISFCGG